MTKHLFAILSLSAIPALAAMAQSTAPNVSPTATYTTSDGEETDDATSGQSAPLTGLFMANPSDIGDYEVRYEWKVYEPGKEDAPLVHRFEENLEYTFTQSGSFRVQLYATFVLDGDTIQYPEEGEETPFVVSISESKLEFPNAFSPNGDGYNDILKAKDGYQSIVKFEASVFNRWGHKLYSWSNPAEGWDGKAGGKTVSDGAYFLVVNAMGADGRKFKFRKTINVLTRLREQDQVVDN